MILVNVTTVSETFIFFRGQIEYLQERGFQVHAVSSPGELINKQANQHGIIFHPIEMTRSITLDQDLKALVQLVRLFHRIKPDIVNASTAKGGLLGGMAAWLTGVPIKIHTMRGLLSDTGTGLRRGLYYWTDALPCITADRVIAVSHSIRRKAIAKGICSPEKIQVIGAGSSNGVDARGRFNPDRLRPKIREEVRQQYHIPSDALVLGFVGRIVRDKGIMELAEAWQQLRSHFPSLYLLLVGSLEPFDPVAPSVIRRLQEDERVCFTGKIRDIAPLYKAMDLLVLPTYREGFPNTPLEGAAMELPVVATQVEGCIDAVVHGKTGLLVPPRDCQALTEAVRYLLSHEKIRQDMGQTGRQRVLTDFVPERIWQGLYEIYKEMIHWKKLSKPTLQMPYPTPPQ